MRLKKTAAAGLMLVGLGSASLAAPPPLDRPSPPPCCADGRGYSNPCTFGWYATRWRRWPYECTDSMPGGQLGPARQEGLGLPKYEPPAPNDEDRKAPPPTTPPEEPSRGPASNAPASGTENKASSGSAGQFPAPAPAPPSGFLNQPSQPTEPNSPRRGYPAPYVPQGPTPKSLDSTGPTSEVDPPPALPFGPRMMIGQSPLREAQQRPVAPTVEPAKQNSGTSSDDPPPTLPSVLATLSR